MGFVTNIASWLVILGGIYLGTMGLNVKIPGINRIPPRFLNMAFIAIGVAAAILLFGKFVCDKIVEHAGYVKYEGVKGEADDRASNGSGSRPNGPGSRPNGSESQRKWVNYIRRRGRPRAQYRETNVEFVRR